MKPAPSLPMPLMRRAFLACALAAGAALLPQGAQAAPAACGWPGWEGFRNQFIEDGRVVDPAQPQRYTTSEGQSYAMFFALVANDRATFDHLLRWTTVNLSDGDLGRRLPAWQWGQKADGSSGVIDTNAAADADLWIAYTLAEAARLWKYAPYAATAKQLAERIAREETLELQGFGRVLLPGPQGFVTTVQGAAAPSAARLNPSYVPVQLLRRLDASYPGTEWRAVMKSSLDMLLRSAPAGYAPDWIEYNGNNGFQPDRKSKAVGSYDAIRVYLWAGMLAEDDPARALLLRQYAPMAKQTAGTGVPPESVDTRSGKADGDGPSGFSAAILPLLASAHENKAADQQRKRITARAPLARKDNYFDQVLTLFGTGWDAGRYRFRRDGSLQVTWSCATK